MVLEGSRRRRFGINSMSVHVRFMVVSVSLEKVPVREFLVASVGVVPQVLHTNLRGSVTRRANVGRLRASHKALSEIREYLIENCHLIFEVLMRKPWECHSYVTRPQGVSIPTVLPDGGCLIFWLIERVECVL
jgi:hypothetical protein